MRPLDYHPSAPAPSLASLPRPRPTPAVAAVPVLVLPLLSLDLLDPPPTFRIPPPVRHQPSFLFGPRPRSRTPMVRGRGRAPNRSQTLGVYRGFADLGCGFPIRGSVRGH